MYERALMWKLRGEKWISGRKMRKKKPGNKHADYNTAVKMLPTCKSLPGAQQDKEEPAAAWAAPGRTRQKKNLKSDYMIKLQHHLCDPHLPAPLLQLDEIRNTRDATESSFRSAPDPSVPSKWRADLQPGPGAGAHAAHLQKNSFQHHPPSPHPLRPSAGPGSRPNR